MNVFTLILINERYDLFCKFYSQIKSSIEKITAISIDSIVQGKTKEICERVLYAMLEQLNLSMSIALAPTSLSNVSKFIVKEFAQNGTDVDFSSVFQDAQDIRNANMFWRTERSDIVFEHTYLSLVSEIFYAVHYDDTVEYA